MLASVHGGHEMVKALLARGAPVYATNVEVDKVHNFEWSR
jgi:hypothetical protein